MGADGSRGGSDTRVEVGSGVGTVTKVSGIVIVIKLPLKAPDGYTKEDVDGTVVGSVLVSACANRRGKHTHPTRSRSHFGALQAYP